MADERGQKRGSGTSVEDPFRLDAMHPVAGELSEIAIISQIFGKEDHDWFHHQCLSHANNIREWQIRLNSGQIRRVFFDESRFTDSIPLPDKVREILEDAAAKRAVPDATLISRFPLIEVRAKTAAEAGRIVLTHINEARAWGWKKGNMHMGVDGWRFDQELFRGSEKTMMMFDMRPARVHIRGIYLAMFCGLDSFEAIDQLERRMKSYPVSSSAVPVRVVLRNLFSRRFLKLPALIGVIAGTLDYLFASHSVVEALLVAVILPLVIVSLVLIKVRSE